MEDLPDLPQFWSDLKSIEAEFPRIVALYSSEDVGVGNASEFFECVITGLRDASMPLATKLVSATVLYVEQDSDTDDILIAFREYFPRLLPRLLQIGRLPGAHPDDLPRWDDRFAEGASQLIHAALSHLGILLRTPPTIVACIKCAAAAALACTMASPIICAASAENCPHTRLLSRAALICVVGLTRMSMALPAALPLVEKGMSEAYRSGGSCGLQWGGLLLGLLCKRVTVSLEATWTPDTRPLAQSIRLQVLTFLRGTVPTLEDFRGEAFRSNHVGEIERLRSLIPPRRAAESRDTAASSVTGGGTLRSDRVLPVCRCGTAATFFCGGCNSVAYCGRDCQRAAWKSGHKEECRRG